MLLFPAISMAVRRLAKHGRLEAARLGFVYRGEGLR
jgi:hypothetical protein